MSDLTVRYFGAFKDGRLVATCTSIRPYRFCVWSHASRHAVWKSTHAGAVEQLRLLADQAPELLDDVREFISLSTPALEAAAGIPASPADQCAALESLYRLS